MTQPQIVQPQQVPETWIPERTPDGKHVVVRIHGVFGVHVSILDAAAAIQIGETIANIGRDAGGGIIKPPPGFVLPPVNGHG